jgi:hypothetical protein
MNPQDHFRALARRPVALSALLSSSDAGWHRPARVVDLGLGGARLEIQGTLESGTVVTLEVDTPHLWDPLRLGGTIAWCQPDQAAGDSRPEVVSLRSQCGLSFGHNSGPKLRALVLLLAAEGYD